MFYASSENVPLQKIEWTAFWLWILEAIFTALFCFFLWQTYQNEHFLIENAFEASCLLERGNVYNSPETVSMYHLIAKATELLSIY